MEAQKQVEQCGVVVKEHGTRIVTAIAFITLNKMGSENELLDKLNLALRSGLPEHLQPTEIHVIDNMPMTPSGKIDYQALEKWVEEKRQ